MLHRLVITLIIVLLIPAYSAFVEVNNDTILKFVQISDNHISLSGQDNSRRLFANSTELLKDAIAQINALKNINFVIFTGDMIESASDKELTKFISIADTLKYSWYPVLGNHDVSVGGFLNKTKLVEILATKTKGMKNNQTYYTFYPNDNCAVIVLDGSSDKTNTVHGNLSPEQLNWLNSELEKNSDKVIIIASHFPIEPPFGGSGHSMVEPAKTKVLEIFKKHKNIALVINGHYHTTKIFKKDGILYASAPSLVEYPNAFRVITIKENGDIFFEWKETSLKELQAKSKRRSKWASTSLGSKTDQNASVNYKQ